MAVLSRQGGVWPVHPQRYLLRVAISPIFSSLPSFSCKMKWDFLGFWACGLPRKCALLILLPLHTEGHHILSPRTLWRGLCPPHTLFYTAEQLHRHCLQSQLGRSLWLIQLGSSSCGQFLHLNFTTNKLFVKTQPHRYTIDLCVEAAMGEEQKRLQP